MGKSSFVVFSGVFEVVGLGFLVGFTGIIIFISLISGGALIYYYESNPLIWLFEVAMGCLGVCVGLVKIYEVVEEIM